MHTDSILALNEPNLGAEVVPIRRLRDEDDFTHLLTCNNPRAQNYCYDTMLPLRKVLIASGHGGSVLLRAIKA